MGLQPNIKKTKKFMLKACSHCGGSFGEEGFAPTKSVFYPDGVIPICNDCIDADLAANNWDWDYLDKMC